MSKMISVMAGFQYSVNIAFDLYDDAKLKSFIPTSSSLALLESILVSTQDRGTNRARILIGAYGKGKSHIVLAILSILLRIDFSLFEKLHEKLHEYPKLRALLEDYYNSEKKLLPIIVTGANTSLSQAFILSLERTLRDNDLMDIMPETNYKAAILTIERWKREFPETLKLFEEKTGEASQEFIKRLGMYDIESYEAFEKVYPILTSGSEFNPFLGFDVVEIYENVAKALKSRGYNGLYVVYDEFSKYLESNITTAGVSDTKMLQDFAEKCCRSGETQLHLMLISHKEIANYIDKLPKSKIDGWRGISERFEHVILNNNFSQTYEVIQSAIIHNPSAWETFYRANKSLINNEIGKYWEHSMFSDVNEGEIQQLITGCYPLHPVSMFMLPRLSERVAQNERTLFTFLSANGSNTFSSILQSFDDQKVRFITPDRIFDYFEPLFKKELYDESLKEIYALVRIALDKVESAEIETRLLKTIALVYIVEQFEKLAPTIDELLMIYSAEYGTEAVKDAIYNLINSECVVYLKRTNGFLKIKNTSGINIREEIDTLIAKQKSRIVYKDILNECNNEPFLYPSRYNDEKEMTRYFSFVFIDSREITVDTNWNVKLKSLSATIADGYVIGVLVDSESEIERVKNILLQGTELEDSCIFVLPKKCRDITSVLEEFYAVAQLKELAGEDNVLFDEYEVIYEDLIDVINAFITSYFRPESSFSLYIHRGEIQNISRKSGLTALMSEICYRLFPSTPVINAEVINKNEISGVANGSRRKIIAALLRNDLEQNLGFRGNGQEVSILRSTLVRTGLLDWDSYPVHFNIENATLNIQNMLYGVIKILQNARGCGSISFQEIYDYLTLPRYKIGLRKGLIPIYLAVVFQLYKHEVIISDRQGQVALTADVLEQINARPELFSLQYLEWNPEKERYVKQLETLYKKFVIEEEKALNPYDYIVSAMKRWYLALPRVVKDAKYTLDGDKIPVETLTLVRALKSDMQGGAFLFEYLPKAYKDEKYVDSLIGKIGDGKRYYDSLFDKNKQAILQFIRDTFSLDAVVDDQISTFSIIKDWLDTLDVNVFTHVFENRADKCLKIFVEMSADTDQTLNRLAKLTVGLRLEDWNADSFAVFKSKLIEYKDNLEGYSANRKQVETFAGVTNRYEITYLDAAGNQLVKAFDRVDIGKRGELFLRMIEQQISAMGQSISDGEKRQVLVDILQKLLD